MAAENVHLRLKRVIKKHGNGSVSFLKILLYFSEIIIRRIQINMLYSITELNSVIEYFYRK